jgi:hypothetical protein
MKGKGLIPMFKDVRRHGYQLSIIFPGDFVWGESYHRFTDEQRLEAMDAVFSFPFYKPLEPLTKESLNKKPKSELLKAFEQLCNPPISPKRAGNKSVLIKEKDRDYWEEHFKGQVFLMAPGDPGTTGAIFPNYDDV